MRTIADTGSIALATWIFERRTRQPFFSRAGHQVPSGAEVPAEGTRKGSSCSSFTSLTKNFIQKTLGYGFSCSSSRVWTTGQYCFLKSLLFFVDLVLELSPSPVPLPTIFWTISWTIPETDPKVTFTSIVLRKVGSIDWVCEHWMGPAPVSRSRVLLAFRGWVCWSSSMPRLLGCLALFGPPRRASLWPLGIQRSMSSSRCPWRICTTSKI